MSRPQRKVIQALELVADAWHDCGTDPRMALGEIDRAMFQIAMNTLCDLDERVRKAEVRANLRVVWVNRQAPANDGGTP